MSSPAPLVTLESLRSSIEHSKVVIPDRETADSMIPDIATYANSHVSLVLSVLRGPPIESRKDWLNHASMAADSLALAYYFHFARRPVQARKCMETFGIFMSGLRGAILDHISESDQKPQEGDTS